MADQIPDMVPYFTTQRNGPEYSECACQKDRYKQCNSGQNMFLKRLRIHSQHTMDGLMFVEFIAMILRSEIQVVSKKSKLSDSLCISELFSELRKLKQITFGKKKALTEISRTQKDIFAAFGIKLDPQN